MWCDNKKHTKQRPPVCLYQLIRDHQKNGIDIKNFASEWKIDVVTSSPDYPVSWARRKKCANNQAAT